MCAMLYGNDDPKNDPFGIVLILVAQCFAGMMFIVEEKLLGSYYLNPLYVVGWEGIWGFLMYVIILVILQHAHIDGKPIEDTMLAFKKIENSSVIFGMCFGIICSISSFNALGVATTKNASSA